MSKKLPQTDSSRLVKNIPNRGNKNPIPAKTVKTPMPGPKKP